VQKFGSAPDWVGVTAMTTGGTTTQDVEGSGRATDLPAVARPRSDVTSPRLSWHLVLLVTMTLVPLMVVATFLIREQALDKRANTEDSLHSTARALSVAVDSQLTSYRLMLEALAQSELIDRGEFATFHAFVSRVAQKENAISISLFDPSGRQIVNTRQPFGSNLPNPMQQAQPPKENKVPVGDRDTMKRVFATGAPANSDLYFGLSAQRLMFTVDVPVMRGDQVLYVLNAGFGPETITRLLTGDKTLRDVRAVVVDRRGFIVGRWHESDKYTGVPLRPETLEVISTSEAGSAFTTTVDNQQVFRAFVRSPQTGWTTLVALGEEELMGQELRIWLVWGSAALAALCLSMLAAAMLARRLDRAIVGLAQAAENDSVPAQTGLRSRELDGLRDALIKARESRAAASSARESALREETRRTEAEAANREKDRFMAAVVHELRNPLSALTNVAALLQAGVRDERVVAIVQRQVAQLSRLVDDLMETSRLRVGKFQLKLTQVDLRDVIRQAIEAASLRHRDKRQLMQTTWPPHEVTVEGDPARLTQVVSNLVDNAMKFTPAGGEIRVSLATHVGHAVLRIVDSGTGIDPEFLPHVFERFRQATGTPGASEGLGLGLAVARDLVLAHKGHIEITSAGVGRGTTITVTLPIVVVPATQTT
jgi:signal transduction histidine kinase